MKDHIDRFVGTADTYCNALADLKNATGPANRPADYNRDAVVYGLDQAVTKAKDDLLEAGQGLPESLPPNVAKSLRAFLNAVQDDPPTAPPHWPDLKGALQEIADRAKLATADSMAPCPQCGGPRSADVDAPDGLCWVCRNPEMGALDVLIRTSPERLNDTDYPELPSIRQCCCKLFGHPFFDLKTWDRLKDWLQAEHKKTLQDVLGMKRADVLALLQAADAAKRGDTKSPPTDQSIATSDRPYLLADLCKDLDDRTYLGKVAAVHCDPIAWQRIESNLAKRNVEWLRTICKAHKCEFTSSGLETLCAPVASASDKTLDEFKKLPVETVIDLLQGKSPSPTMVGREQPNADLATPTVKARQRAANGGTETDETRPQEPQSLVEIADTARLLYTCYPQSADEYRRAKRALQFLRDAESRAHPERPLTAFPEKGTMLYDAMHDYKTQSDQCRYKALMVGELGLAVAKRLPDLWPSLRLVSIGARWHEDEDFDWDAAIGELRQIEAAALNATLAMSAAEMEKNGRNGGSDVSTTVDQPEDRKLRYVGTGKDHKDPIEGTSIVMQAMAFDTPTVCRLMEDARRLWPNEGENCSSEFVLAVSRLHGAIYISEAEWAQTGESVPKSRREFERLLGLIGCEDLVGGDWTPARLAPMLIGSLQRRREKMALATNTERSQENGGGTVATTDPTAEQDKQPIAPIPPLPVEIPPEIAADGLMQSIILYRGNSQSNKKTGKQIAAGIRTPLNGHLKEKLAALRRMTVFAAGQGYPLSEMGQKIYRVLKDRTKSS